ncbi:MAG: glutamyl-tRNA amidotransferase [Cyanobacteria bacterium J06632_3]
MSDTMRLAVNGTLMRGLSLNPNMLNVGATFVREAKTEPCYRIWSIDDNYPAMIKVSEGGVSVALEVWEVPLAGLGKILSQEPPGLAIGKVKLSDGENVLGVIGEPLTVEGKREITEYGGWRAYREAFRK